VDPRLIFNGLNEEQRRAVEAVRGPVCILAGAGSGKTTTITRRIAYQVATRTFAPTEILAVTFTDKAAGEMRARLAQLGADAVSARTFHAAALAAGGQSDGAPGARPEYSPGYYAAFFFDPDGIKLEVVHEPTRAATTAD